MPERRHLLPVPEDSSSGSLAQPLRTASIEAQDARKILYTLTPPPKVCHIYITTTNNQPYLYIYIQSTPKSHRFITHTRASLPA
jgi:hypothetical protein